MRLYLTFCFLLGLLLNGAVGSSTLAQATSQPRNSRVGRHPERGGSRYPLQRSANPVAGRAAVASVARPPAARPPQPTTTNLLTGKVYFDENGNGYRDSAESAFPRPVVVLDQVYEYAATSDPDSGRFTVVADTGYYDLRVAEAPLHYTVLEGAFGYNGYFNAAAQLVDSSDFGLAPIPNQQDLRVTLTPYSGLRPGLPQRYRARLENVGTTVIDSGEVVITIDTAATIIGTVPPTSPGTGATRTWRFTNLAPFAVRNFDLTFSMPVTTPLGLVVSSSASAYAPGREAAPDDNFDILTQNVTSSYDPNDLAVNHTELTLAQLAAGERLDYLVRFENLGNDTAFIVSIVDSLPAALLQLGTLQMVSTSHNCQWAVSGRGELTLNFPGIQLPYQAVDALRSQGFVRFRIRPRATLAPGTLIPGQAYITFDFNAAIATNQVATLIGMPQLGAPDQLTTDPSGWALYPNPATTTVAVTAEVPLAGPASVRVFDAAGRSVRTRDATVASGPLHLPLDLYGLPPGIYAVQLSLPGGLPTVRRLVIQ